MRGTPVLLLFVALSVPSHAVAATDEVASGPVAASLTYETQDFGARDVRIRVRREGTLLVDDAGPGSGGSCSRACQFRPLNAGRESSVFLRDLDGDPEREVLIEFFTGGANCCLMSRIYDFDAARGRYRRIDRNWETSSHRGARDLGGDGVFEFLSGDARFKYRFGCGACGPPPIRIFRLREGRLRDVTRRFRPAIRRDLRMQAKLFRRTRKDRLLARGTLAPLIADRYLLGQGGRARRTLDDALRRGYLRGTRGDGIPDGRAYVRALLRFLRRTGYRG